MLRVILGAVIGIFAWVAVVGVASFLLRAVAPDVNAAMVAHSTVIAMCERLAISFLASLVGGYLAMLVARDSRGPLFAGVLLLLGWGYFHVMVIWHQFPLWYHLTFFVSLPLLSVLGGRLARRG